MEELQCLAVWKEGSSRYLVGKVHHSHATSNEDRFRCFVYEKASAASEAIDGVDYRVAQSGDATCNGLFSATEGSRTMTLKKGKWFEMISRRHTLLCTMLELSQWYTRRVEDILDDFEHVHIFKVTSKITDKI